MSRTRWHILREDGGLTLTRHLPVRFDVSATTVLGYARMLPLAHQIRQDIWRSLQNLRGFSPVVRVSPKGDDVQITAGGRIDGAAPCAVVETRLQEVLEHPGNRARWTRWAR